MRSRSTISWNISQNTKSLTPNILNIPRFFFPFFELFIPASSSGTSVSEAAVDSGVATTLAKDTSGTLVTTGVAGDGGSGALTTTGVGSGALGTMGVAGVGSGALAAARGASSAVVSCCSETLVSASNDVP